MDKFIYDPAAAGEPDDDFGDALKRAKILAQKLGPIDLMLHGISIAVNENTTVPQACIGFADGMMFPNHTPADIEFFRRTPFKEAEPGLMEEHVAKKPDINLSELSIALKFGKLLQAQQAQGVALSTCWNPCFMKAGGELFPKENILPPVAATLRETWANGFYLDMTIRRATGGNLDFKL